MARCPSVSALRASRRAARSPLSPPADRGCAAPGARPGSLPETERADLVRLAGDRRLGAALGDILLQVPEGLHVAARTLAVLGLVPGDVHEAHAVVELERRVAKSRGSGPLELRIYGADQPLVLLRPLGLDLV